MPPQRARLAAKQRTTDVTHRPATGTRSRARLPPPESRGFPCLGRGADVAGLPLRNQTVPRGIDPATPLICTSSVIFCSTFDIDLRSADPSDRRSGAADPQDHAAAADGEGDGVWGGRVKGVLHRPRPTCSATPAVPAVQSAHWRRSTAKGRRRGPRTVPWAHT